MQLLILKTLKSLLKSIRHIKHLAILEKRNYMMKVMISKIMMRHYISIKIKNNMQQDKTNMHNHGMMLINFSRKVEDGENQREDKIFMRKFLFLYNKL